MTENEILNNRYQLVRPIGRGSFGEVWMAKDLQLDITVAVKVYAALDGKGITEFKDEFKNVYKLHHPNLLRPDYFDTVGDNPYLVMPYCPKSADGLAGQMTEHELWHFIRDVASGLAYLHDSDVIHRDIKPENILLDERGDYVITDFGLSTKMRSTLRQASMRQNDGFSGTIAYMAPELFTSKPTAVKATDVWALGVTIYEMATGELPFCGQGGCMLNAGAEIPELDSTKWSSNLNDVMRLCLDKQTWGRPTSNDLAEYSKLVLGGDKRNWSQWKGADNSESRPTPRPRHYITYIYVAILSLIFAVICYVQPKSFFANGDNVTLNTNLNSEQYVLSVTNLSLSGTANCYIVSKAGRYKFKVVKGNSTEAIGLVAYSDVLWESFGTNKVPIIGDLVSNVSYEDDYIEFDATGRKGNAVIAAKDANGKILWSWHIWLTDMPEEQVYYNDAGTMMDRNLGATSATPGDVHSLGLLYQWGRKDPFLGSSSIRRNKEAKSTISWPLPKKSTSNTGTTTSNTGTIEYSITNPTTFIIGEYWSYIKNSLWQSSKTIYDPCPIGWRVPDGGENGIWSKATSSKTFSCKCIRKSMNLSGILGLSKSICYPISGKRSYYDGGIGNVGGYGYLWSSTTSSTGPSVNYLSLNSEGYGSSSYYPPLSGCSVRCVKDTEKSSKDLNYHSKSKNLSVDKEANKDKPHFGLG